MEDIVYYSFYEKFDELAQKLLDRATPSFVGDYYVEARVTGDLKQVVVWRAEEFESVRYKEGVRPFADLILAKILAEHEGKGGNGYVFGAITITSTQTSVKLLDADIK